MSKTNNYSPEIREEALRLAQEAPKDRPSLWATVVSTARMMGCSTVTLHQWAKKVEIDTGLPNGLSRFEPEEEGLGRKAAAFYVPGGGFMTMAANFWARGVGVWGRTRALAPWPSASLKGT